MQSNSYMNACYSISAARCGKDDGKYDLIAGSTIVDPEGYIVAEAQTIEDEVVVAEIDLEKCWPGKEKVSSGSVVMVFARFLTWARVLDV